VCHIIIFKFLPAVLHNAEHNSHNLEMFGILRKQSQGSSLWNEIMNLDVSWDNFINIISRLRRGGQRNNVLISPRGKVFSLESNQNGLRRMWTPFGLESVLSLPRFRATDLLNLKTTDAVLKSKNLLILSIPLLLNFVRRYLTLTSIRSAHLKLSKFPYCNTE
jgi:hypothetical protein